MREYINDLLLFFQFFTRIPINKNLKCEKENFRRGSIFFPLVGLFLGFSQWLVYYFSIKVFSASITAVFVVMISIMLTGANHVDGLGDTCDGFFAFKGGGKEKIIEIMKDSRVGTFSSIAIVFDMLIRYAAVSTAIEKNIPLIIIAAPVISKFSVVFICFIGKCAKKTGSGNIFIGNIDLKRMAITTLFTFVFIFKFTGIKYALILMVSSLIFTILFNKYSESKIDGLTGDILGANNELVDILMMLVYIAMN
jgi:adenosylcobinamide-GDP ribazoletransferase